MLYLYDKAMENKLKDVFENTTYAPVDKFYERHLLANSNQPVKLPALSIWRVSHEFKPGNARTQVSIPNFSMIHPDEDYAKRNIYSMQISLSYHLDIWASTDIDRDDMMQELLYFLTLYPDIFIEYQGQKFEFPIIIEPPDDVTDIANFGSTGDLYRVTIPLQVPDARLMFYQDTKTCKFIDISYYVNKELDSISRIGNQERSNQ